MATVKPESERNASLNTYRTLLSLTPREWGTLKWAAQQGNMTGRQLIEFILRSYCEDISMASASEGGETDTEFYPRKGRDA